MRGELAQIDNTIDIVTPENIAFGYRVAGPFRRFPAFLLDLLVRFVVFSILIWIGGLTSFAFGGASVALMILTWFVLEWFYGGVFETLMNGQTPGKWVLGIRVLTIEGQPIDGMQAIMRNILRYADMYPLVSLEMFGIPAPVYDFLPTMMLGLGFMMMNRRYQRLGDLVCGTMVVIEDRQWLAGLAKLEDHRAAQLASHLPPDFQVSRTLARALAHYVERRRYFSAARRKEVARYLAEPLLREFGLPGDTSHDLLLCALYHRTFIADRLEPGAEVPRSPFAPPQMPPSPVAVGSEALSPPDIQVDPRIHR